MNYITPEQAGISSADVLAFYRELEANYLSTHAVLLARGNSIFSECYYAPFDRSFKHRMYSVSKTFVSMAIGFCEQDGLLSLDDPMVKYFDDYVKDKDPATLPTATIREMLQMRTSTHNGTDWFKTGCTDRTEVYFRKAPDKLPGTLFAYDSSGSYMLGVIVERLTGKPFLAYLQEKVLDAIGFSKDAYCIKAPGGHSFGDSGVMCTANDLLLFARFILNGGTWQGKRYLNEQYIKDATTMIDDGNIFGFADHSGTGYGYQIWGMDEGCFAMLGMGNQIALCDPAHDFIFVINSDNQGNAHNYEQIFTILYRTLIHKLNDGTPLAPAPLAQAELHTFEKSRKLFCLAALKTSPYITLQYRKIFTAASNPMGIKWFRLDFKGDEATFTYENAQGEKQMPMGFGHNAFARFPQTGYADLVATVPVPGHTYHAAFSADWSHERHLRMRVQIIDKYFGNLGIIFCFRDEKHVSVRMERKAEAFLHEYEGIMIATAE